MTNLQLLVTFVDGPRDGESDYVSEDAFPVRYQGGEYHYVDMNPGDGIVQPGHEFPTIKNDIAQWHPDVDLEQ